MKDKIYISIIVTLFLALFLETAYVLQLRFENKKSQESSYNIEPFKHYNKFWDNDLFSFHYGPNFLEPFNRIGKIQQPIFEETEGNYIIKLKLPNMEKEKVNVEIEGDALVISSESKKNKKSNKLGFYTNEQSFSTFRQVIPLPGEIKIDEITTNYTNNVLTIILPKADNLNHTKRHMKKIQV